MGCDCENSGSSCNDDCPPVSATCEALPSALENFINNFFGQVQKSVVNGQVVWTLPCDLATGLPENPRLPGEGLACYFKRLFEDGITGLTGATGATGAAGADGKNGFYTLAVDFNHAGNVIQVTDGTALGIGQYIFVPSSGWYLVDSFTDNTAFVELISAVSSPSATISAGAVIALTGPKGPIGATGATGPQGVQGTAGPAGSNGSNGENAFATIQTTFAQPAIGGLTGNLTFSNAGWVSVGMTVYIKSGGFYQVFAKSGNQINLTNLYGVPQNVAPATNVASGNTVSPAGVQGPAADFAFTEVVKTGDYVMDGSEGIIFGDPSAGDFTITLPDVTTVKAGKEFLIKKISGGANKVILHPVLGQTIDNSGADKNISAAYDFARLVSDTSKWWLTG